MSNSSRLIAATADFGGGFQPVTGAYSQGSADPSGQGALSNLELAISNGIGFLTVLAGLMFIFYFVSAALNWISAGGDSGKIQKARDQMMNGVIGLIVIVAAYGVVGLIGSVIGLRLLNPGEQLFSIIESIR